MSFAPTRVSDCDGIGSIAVNAERLNGVSCFELHLKNIDSNQLTEILVISDSATVLSPDTCCKIVRARLNILDHM